MKQFIKDRTGNILGWVDVAPNGDKTAWSMSPNKILGYYKASSNKTVSVTGKLIAYGDIVSALIPGVVNLIR